MSTSTGAEGTFGALLARVAAAPPLFVPELYIGRSIGRYTIVRKIGRGGMGVVLLAQDEQLRRPVALKALVGMHAGDDALAREARALAAVSHPHIAEVYEIVHDAEQAFLVMEYCPGGTLAERIAGLDPASGRTILRQVAEGLAAAHRSGIVHRDIKPSNIVFSAADVPKIADFGIAAVSGSSPFVAGTPRYMAPEQAKPGTAVGPPADVFAFGRVIEEWQHACAGRPPDASVLKLAAHCTAPQPADRPQNGAALVDALSRRTPLQRRGVFAATAAALGVALLLAGLAVVALSRPGPVAHGPQLAGTPAQQARFARAVSDFLRANEQGALIALDDLLASGLNDPALATLRLAIAPEHLSDAERHRLAGIARDDAVLVNAVRIQDPRPAPKPKARHADARIAEFGEASGAVAQPLYDALIAAHAEPVAETRADMLRALDPTVNQVALALSRTLHLLGDDQGAMTAINTARAENSDDRVEAFSLRMQLQRLEADAQPPAQAVKAFARLMKAYPLAFSFRAAHVRALRRSGGLSATVSAVEDLVTLNLWSGDAPRLAAELAAVADDQGHPALAQRLFDSALSRFLKSERFDDAAALVHHRVTGALIFRDAQTANTLVTTTERLLNEKALVAPWRDILTSDNLALAGWLDVRAGGDGIAAAPLLGRPDTHFLPPFGRDVLDAIVHTERRLVATHDSNIPTDIVPPAAIVDGFPKTVGARWALDGARSPRGLTSAQNRALAVLRAADGCPAQRAGFVRRCTGFRAHLALALAKKANGELRTEALAAYAAAWPEVDHARPPTDGD